jgi:hypothetical protein
MHILIFLACCWLGLPLLRIFLPLAFWFLTQRIFWIGLGAIAVLMIAGMTWSYQEGQAGVRETQAWNASHPSAYIRACQQLGLDPDSKITGIKATQLNALIAELQ